MKNQTSFKKYKCLKCDWTGTNLMDHARVKAIDQVQIKVIGKYKACPNCHSSYIHIVEGQVVEQLTKKPESSPKEGGKSG